MHSATEYRHGVKSRRRVLAVTAAALLVAATRAGSAPAPLPLNIGGRTVARADGARLYGWPGSYFEGRFRGTAVRVRFEAPFDNLRLLIDGAERRVFRDAGPVDLLVDGLPDGVHLVRLELMSESKRGAGTFFGFFPAAGATALPALARQRQIEFIGDSYTVGLGDLSSSRACDEAQDHALTDTNAAYGAIVARAFGADYRINARSGFGMLRNYDGGRRGPGLVNPTPNMPALYPRLLPQDAASAKPDGGEPGVRAWRPQLVIINLGTNDFSTALHPDEQWKTAEAFEAAYLEQYERFARQIARREPQARILLMGSDRFFPLVQRVARTIDPQGRRFATLQFGGLALDGCNTHPSLADHALLAQAVERAVRSLYPDWR